VSLSPSPLPSDVKERSKGKTKHVPSLVECDGHCAARGIEEVASHSILIFVVITVAGSRECERNEKPWSL